MKTSIFYFIVFAIIYAQATAQEPVKVEEYAIKDYRSYKNIHFDKDSIEIRKIAYPILSFLVDILKKEYPDYVLQIKGFVDNEEFISKPSLALQRANAVKEYFAKNGISKQRIIVKDGGQAEIPEGYDEWKEEMQEMMRRVTFSMVKKE